MNTPIGFLSIMSQNYYFSAKQNAKRLHGDPTGLIEMYSPSFLMLASNIHEKH